MLNQINGINFPLNLNDIQANVNATNNINEIKKLLNISISTIQTNHHGDCIGYRLKSNEFDVCFLPDNQLHNPKQTLFDDFINFCKNSKLLIHDCQYTQKDMPGKENWGHSIVEDAYRLCNESKCEKLILFHHDPEREKKDILTIEKEYNNKMILLAQLQPTRDSNCFTGQLNYPINEGLSYNIYMMLSSYL